MIAGVELTNFQHLVCRTLEGSLCTFVRWQWSTDPLALLLTVILLVVTRGDVIALG